MDISVSDGPMRSRSTKVTALICAAVITVMLVAQLFGYEDFWSALSVIMPITDQHIVEIVAAALVMVELLSLPYLLGMYISRLMRVVSVLAGMGTCGFWLIMTLTNAHASNSALLSTTVDIPGGVLAVLWSTVLMGLFLRVFISDTRFRHDRIQDEKKLGT